ncbi:MAG: CRISPR-associated protein Csx19 [Rhodocyclaceae bacterium]|nr:CRISPR-associated protein Csx19 [Rhodocyclaceae bacterium]MDW8324772.1 CRISPR-associated protein Csx19 [Burkholderiales bacterium]
MNTLTLYRCTHPRLGVAEAAAILPGAVGYLYSPRSFWIARVTNRGLEASGAPLSSEQLQQVYEVRLATDQAELRWLRDPADGMAHGRAALLSETPITLPPGWEKAESLEGLHKIDTPIILTAVTDRLDGQGWLVTNAPRHGEVHLPWQGDPPLRQSRIAWCWREYLGPAPGAAGQDGNVTVLAARLSGLTALTA